MSNYAVLGLGLMGTAICYDLLSYDSKKVIGLDISHKQQEKASNTFRDFENQFESFPLELNLTNDLENHPLIDIFQDNNIKVVFGAIDYKFNYFLSKLCIHAGVSFVDLGGNPSIVQSQKALHESAKKANVTIIPDLGLAPGMTNIIAAYGMKKFDELDECHLRVGGLPQKPKTLLKYQQVFSIRGLINEYLEDAIIIRKRKKTIVPSLSENEQIEFPEPWGKLEAFQTAGGSSSLPDLFENHINELTYKTIRYPGHYQFFKFLKETGLLSSEAYPKNPNITPREVIEHYLEHYLPKGEPDVVLVRITITGKIKDQQETHIYQLIDYADITQGFSAMARTTAFPTSIIGQFLANRKISRHGVFPGEIIVPFDAFLTELKKRNITFDFRKDLDN